MNVTARTRITLTAPSYRYSRVQKVNGDKGSMKTIVRDLLTFRNVNRYLLLCFRFFREGEQFSECELDASSPVRGPVS